MRDNLAVERRILLCLLALAFAACGSGDDRGGKKTRKKTAKRSPTHAKPPSFMPSELPVCGRALADEPLAVLCYLGRPATEFPSLCKKKIEPYVFRCDQTAVPVALWTCRDMSAKSPKFTFRFETEWRKPLPALGQTFTPPAPSSKDTIVGVGIFARTPTPAASKNLATAWRKQLLSLGCRRINDTVFACGAWKVKVKPGVLERNLGFEAQNEYASSCDAK